MKRSFVPWAGSAAGGHLVALSVGVIVAGAAAYGYIALGTHTYGAGPFAPVAVVFSLWPAAAAAFGFPLEQWIARELARGPDGEARVNAMLRRAVPTIAAICVLGGLISWAVGDQIFGDSGPFYPALLVGVSLGTATMGVLFGGLAGRGRYVALSTATAMETLLRLGVGALVVAADLGLQTYAAVLLVGPLVGLLWLPAFRFRRGTQPVEEDLQGLSELSGATLLSQVVFAAPPIALAVAVGPTAAVTAVFVALALLRAPYLVAVGASIRGLPMLTRRLAAAPSGELAGLLARIAIATGAVALLAAPIAPPLLSGLIGALFGDGAVPSDGALASLAAGAVVAHGALAAIVVLIAAGRNRISFWAWIAACVVNAALLFLLPMDPEVRVGVAFVAAEAVAVMGMVMGAELLGRWPLPR